jgi:hypothetical protein
MNDRIKDIWIKAASEDAGETWDSQEQFIERFAKLIVKECANIGDNYQDILGNDAECFNCRKVAYGIVDRIKHHFGVE